MKDLSPLENSATRKRSNDDILQSVQDISKKYLTDANVSKDNNAMVLADISI